MIRTVLALLVILCGCTEPPVPTDTEPTKEELARIEGKRGKKSVQMTENPFAEVVDDKALAATLRGSWRLADGHTLVVDDRGTFVDGKSKTLRAASPCAMRLGAPEDKVGRKRYSFVSSGDQLYLTDKGSVAVKKGDVIYACTPGGTFIMKGDSCRRYAQASQLKWRSFGARCALAGDETLTLSNPKPYEPALRLTKVGDVWMEDSVAGQPAKAAARGDAGVADGATEGAVPADATTAGPR